MKVRAVIIEADDVSAEDVRVLMQQAFPVLAGGVARSLPATPATPATQALLLAAEASPVQNGLEAMESTAPAPAAPPRHRNVKLASGYRPSSQPPSRPAAKPGPVMGPFKCGACGRVRPSHKSGRATCECGKRWSWVPVNGAAKGEPATAAPDAAPAKPSNGETRPRFEGRAIINPNRVGRPAELDEEDDD